MLEQLPKQFRRVIISRPGRFRASNPEAIQSLLTSIGRSAELIEEAQAALASARVSRLPILIVGSFFLAGEFRPFLTAEEEFGTGMPGGDPPADGSTKGRPPCR